MDHSPDFVSKPQEFFHHEDKDRKDDENDKKISNASESEVYSKLVNVALAYQDAMERSFCVDPSNHPFY